MKIRVVLINYRTLALTLKALRAVLREIAEFPGSRVALIDNDSQDGSYEELQRVVHSEGWSDRVDLIATPRNGGFAYGVTVGVRPGLEDDDPPDYLYLLNSDATPEPGAVAALVRFLERHPEAGIAGSRIYGVDGVTHNTAFRFPSLASEFEQQIGLGLVTRLLDRYVVSKDVPDHDAQVDWLAGASMLIRRQVFVDVGPFDDAFFMYYEETDFCLRARKAGWQTWYVPKSRVEHVGGASTGWKDFRRPRAASWFYSRRYYWLKNHGRLMLWAVNAAWVVGILLGRAKAWLRCRRYHAPPRFLRDFLRYNLRPRYER